MPPRADDQLLADLRRLIADVDPIPPAVHAAACAVFDRRAGGTDGPRAGGSA